MRRTLVSLTIFALAACSAPKDEAPAPTESPSPAAAASMSGNAAPAAFAQCATCHSVEAGQTILGPSLHRVAGRKAGTLAGFAFSDALKNADLTWDDATLDQFLTQPMTKVPGTRMTFAGMPDATKRAEVIAYLKTLK